MRLTEGKGSRREMENGAEGKRKASTAQSRQRHLGARIDIIIIIPGPIDDDDAATDGNAADAVIDVFATCFPKVFTLGITHVCHSVVCACVGKGCV